MKLILWNDKFDRIDIEITNMNQFDEHVRLFCKDFNCSECHFELKGDVEVRRIERTDLACLFG